jgi:hypothetical protein
MKVKTVLYISMSQVEFVAGENDNINFLNAYQVEGEDYESFIKTIGQSCW